MLAIVLVGICLANLDLFIFDIALPDIARSFGGAELDDLSLVLNSYAIAHAALLVLFGRLAERHRRDSDVGLFTSPPPLAALPRTSVAACFRPRVPRC